MQNRITWAASMGTRQRAGKLLLGRKPQVAEEPWGQRSALTRDVSKTDSFMSQIGTIVYKS